MPYLSETAREEILELAAHIHPELTFEDDDHEPADEAALLFVFLVDLAATYVEMSNCDLDTTLLAVHENLGMVDLGQKHCSYHYELMNGEGSADMGIEGVSFAPGKCQSRNCNFDGIVFWTVI